MINHETSVQCVAATVLPTRYGSFDMYVYNGDVKEHVAMAVGPVDNGQPVLVRLHSECLTGDIFGSHRCDCGEQLDAALREVQEAGRGVVLYLRQEGRGIGLTNKIRAYALQQQGLDTVDANRALGLPDDARDYRDAASILHDLGVEEVILMTNNPEKIAGLQAHGVRVVNRQAIHIAPNETNGGYMRTKQQRMGHITPPSAPLAGGELHG